MGSARESRGAFVHPIHRRNARYGRRVRRDVEGIEPVKEPRVSPTCGPGRALNQRGVCAPLASAAVQASPKLKQVQKPVPAQPSSDASASPAGKMYNALQPGMNCQQFGVPQTPQTLSYFCR